jgi:hypothetical protein
MPSSIPEADLHAIVQDLQFLSQHGRGPATIRAEIHSWAALLARADPDAMSLPVVKRTIAQLICLGNANAAFQRSAAPPFYRGPITLDVEDTGGYFLARLLVTTLIRSLPLGSEERLELAQHALAVEDRHKQALERLLPLA